MTKVEASRGVGSNVDCEHRMFELLAKEVEEVGSRGVNIAWQGLCEAKNTGEARLALESVCDAFGGLDGGVLDFEAAHADCVKIHDAFGAGPIDLWNQHLNQIVQLLR